MSANIVLVRAPFRRNKLGKFHLMAINGDKTLCEKAVVANANESGIAGWRTGFIPYPFYGSMCRQCFRPSQMRGNCAQAEICICERCGNEHRRKEPEG